MTLTEIVERIAERLGSPPDLAWGFVDETIKEVIDVLESGEKVKIRGLGTLFWAPVKGRDVPWGVPMPEGVKLKFAPAARFRSRRNSMSMTKYGVVTDDDKTKEAEKEGDGGEDAIPACPICLETLDDAGACPVHGTEPFEPGGQGD